MSSQRSMHSSSQSLVCEPKPAIAEATDPLQAKVRAIYNEDQQEEFFHIRAEVDSLLQQLQALKYQRLASVSSDN